MQKPQLIVQRIQAYRERYAKQEIAVFFLGGFLFDVLTLDRIDNALTIAQHFVYLVALTALILYEERVAVGRAQPPDWLAKAWRFSEDAVHFLLGSLLSSFSLFYFKASSTLSSFLFMALIFAVLVGNELPRFRQLGPVVRVGLYGLCLATFLTYLLPTAFGFLSPILFVLALVLAGATAYGMFRWVDRWTDDRKWSRRRVLLPQVGVLAGLGLLYFTHVLPPLPLATEKIGIYHDMEKLEGDPATGKKTEFRLLHQKPWWKFWSKGDQTFYKRPGDKVWVFTAVFAPTRFSDAVQIQWQRDLPKTGWKNWGKPLVVNVTGGRERGFRTWSHLTDPEPGLYRALVLTDDDRVIGSIRVEVIEDSSTEPRFFREERT